MPLSVQRELTYSLFISMVQQALFSFIVTAKYFFVCLNHMPQQPAPRILPCLSVLKASAFLSLYFAISIVTGTVLFWRF